MTTLSTFANVIEEKGITWALKSTNLMNSYFTLAIKYHKLAQQYPSKTWYASDDPRKALIEKRNGYFNQFLALLKQWGFGKDISELRPWQEKCDDIFPAALDFFELEKQAIAHGLYRIG